MVELFQRPTVRNGVFAGAACLVTLSWTPYFVLLGGVLYGTLVLVTLAIGLYQGRLRSLVVPQLVCLGIVLAFLGGVRAITAVDEDAAGLGHATLADLYQQSARPLMYVVPSGQNPVAGDLTRPFLQRHLWYNNAEKSLYIGISIALLALVGGVCALLGRLPARAGPLALTFSAVTFVALAFSAPPRVDMAGINVPFPDYFVFQLQSGWRIYERFVMVVMLGLCIVAAFGLLALTEGRGRRVRAAILIATAIIVPLDLWSKYEPNTLELTEPSIYRTLHNLPAGIVAEYPIQPASSAEDYDELYNQQFHGKPIINGFRPGTEDEAFALSVAHLNYPDTAGRLAGRGVRYVLLKHRAYVDTIPRPGRAGKGFGLIARSSYADLYSVTARPIALFEAGSGFGGEEGTPPHRLRWAVASPAVLAIRAQCSLCVGEIRFRAGSFNERRRLLTVRQGNRVLLRRTIGSTETVSTPLQFRHRTELVFEFTPPPQPAAEAVPGTLDTRSLGIAVEEPRFIEHRRQDARTGTDRTRSGTG
jgi:hypothetical protein